jgi:hypothetical protein
MPTSLLLRADEVNGSAVLWPASSSRVSAPTWHSSQDLRSALVAAVIQVNELAARERNLLAHLH